MTRHLKCKLDGHDFDCDNNKSGCCTSYISNLGIENAKYECKNNFNKYFELIEEEKDFLCCPICDYETKDSTNKSGVFTNHIKNKHKIDINQFLEKYPDYKVLYPTHLMREGVKKLNENVGIICQICGKKFRKLTETHLAKHNITPNEYKLKYNIISTCSQHTENIQRNKSFARQMDHVFDRIEKAGFTPLFTREEYYGVDPNKYKYKFKCNKCGHIFEDDIGGGYNPICRICNPKAKFEPNRKLEHEIQDFLFNECNIKDVKINDRTILCPKEIDFVIPSHKIGIEIDGLFWHSEDFGKTDSYHINKTRSALEKGYRLIHIFEDEWYEKDIVIKNFFKKILGLTDNTIIPINDCIIKTPNLNEKQEFLFNNHIHGDDNYTDIMKGLYYNNELVSVICFSNPRKIMKSNINDEVGMELIRFACINELNEEQAFQTLLNHIIENDLKKANVPSIYAYADIRYEDMNNNLYTKNNFEYINITRPNYWYTKNSRRYSRYKFLKQDLVKQGYSEDMTIDEIMKSQHYKKIFDCGNIKYRYLIK